MKIKRETNNNIDYEPPKKKRGRPRKEKTDNKFIDELVEDQELNKRQKLFIREYIKDYNALAATVRAGYSEISAPYQSYFLMKNKKVQLAIEKWEKFLANRFINTKERVLKEMSILAFSDIQDYLDVDGNLKIWSELPSQVTRAIKKLKIKTTKRIEKGTNDEIQFKEVEFELYDKKAALDQMGRELGLFKEKKELTGADGTPLIPNGPTTIIFDFGEE